MNGMKKRRIAAGLLLAVALLILLLPFALAAENSLHDCAGHDCAVCRQINVQMRQLLSARRRAACAALLLLLFAAAFVSRRRRGAFCFASCLNRMRLLN